MYRARNIQYEHSDRVRGLASGGIGAMHRVAQHVGLVEAIDRHVEVLKVHLPYHESDHVLGIVRRACGGSTDDDNRTARATGHRPDRQSPRRDLIAMHVIAEPQTRLFWG